MNLSTKCLVACLSGGLLLANACGRNDPLPLPAPQRQNRGGPALRPEPQPKTLLSKQRDEATPRASTSASLQPLAGQTSAPGNGDQANTPSSTAAASSRDLARSKPHPAGDKPKSAKKEQADALFDQPNLLRIQIEIPQSGLALLRRTRWEGGQERPVAKATVREGGMVYTNVAIHLKGAAGSFRQIDSKPALTLKFDKFVPEQNFHGLHKISLNNSVQDGSYLCEKISRELFIAAGVPVPRASHATVELNGRYLGLYVMVEGANRQFLKRFFDHPAGNLYDGGFCRDIGSRLKADCGEDLNNHTGLRALRAAVRDGSYARLEKALDIDRFLSMVALEMMLCHWDGYSLNRNNWRIYHDTEANRMVFIPHGLDQPFGAGRQFEPDSSFVPQQVQGEVTRAVLNTPEGERRYVERFKQIYAEVFKVREINARIDEMVAAVSSALEETDPQTAKAMQRRAKTLKQRIIRRDDGLRQQLGVPLHPQEFDSNGVLALTGWTSVVISGDPVLGETQDPSGKKILRINSGERPSSSSWRTQVVLGPGKYQFEGRIRIAGVSLADKDDRGGAGLRVSKGTMPRKLSGTSDWKDFKYAFGVGAQGSEVELVCELKANAGEAWFDASSLRLVRLQ